MLADALAKDSEIGPHISENQRGIQCCAGSKKRDDGHPFSFPFDHPGHHPNCRGNFSGEYEYLCANREAPGARYSHVRCSLKKKCIEEGDGQSGG